MAAVRRPVLVEAEVVAPEPQRAVLAVRTELPGAPEAARQRAAESNQGQRPRAARQPEGPVVQEQQLAEQHSEAQQLLEVRPPEVRQQEARRQAEQQPEVRQQRARPWAVRLALPEPSLRRAQPGQEQTAQQEQLAPEERTAPGSRESTRQLAAHPRRPAPSPTRVSA